MKVELNSFFLNKLKRDCKVWKIISEPNENNYVEIEAWENDLSKVILGWKHSISVKEIEEFGILVEQDSCGGYFYDSLNHHKVVVMPGIDSHNQYGWVLEKIKDQNKIDTGWRTFVTPEYRALYLFMI